MDCLDAVMINEFVDDSGGAIVGFSSFCDLDASRIEGGIDEVCGFSAELWYIIYIVARSLYGAKDVFSAGACWEFFEVFGQGFEGGGGFEDHFLDGGKEVAVGFGEV